MSEKKDRGWDYLNSNSDDDFDYDPDGDGSWGYQNEDGSGSFYGADGSWGYKNSDGSASYYGNDGSWGYRNSDGSGSYYGNDGSWGYRNSDGSGSFYEADGDSHYYDSSDEDDSDSSSSSSSSSDSGAEALGTLLGFGLAAFMAHKSKKDQERREEEERQEQARIQREIQEKALQSAGFNNIHDDIQNDLGIDDAKKEGVVTAVSISGETDFTSTSRFPYDARVEITYHVVKEITVPMSAKSAKKLVYTDLEEQFKDAGFVNITLEAEYDLITGWITKDGSIESVSVNGETSFDEYASYRPDVPVLITYHTFSKNKDD